MLAAFRFAPVLRAQHCRCFAAAAKAPAAAAAAKGAAAAASKGAAAAPAAAAKGAAAAKPSPSKAKAAIVVKPATNDMAFLAIFKTQPAPEILADDKYPPWVWTMNQVMPTLSTLLAKDYALLSDAEKRRMRKLDRKGRVKRHNDMTRQ